MNQCEQRITSARGRYCGGSVVLGEGTTPYERTAARSPQSAQSPEDRETNSFESGTVLKSNDYEITIEDDDSENEEWVIEDESPNEDDYPYSPAWGFVFLSK